MTRKYNKVVRKMKRYTRETDVNLPDYKEITPEMTEMERRDVETHNQAIRALQEQGERLKKGLGISKYII